MVSRTKELGVPDYEYNLGYGDGLAGRGHNRFRKDEDKAYAWKCGHDDAVEFESKRQVRGES